MAQPDQAQEKISEEPAPFKVLPKYSISDAPSNANEDLLGKRVKIQTFERDKDGDVTNRDSLEILYGVVEAMVLMQDQIIIKLHGCDAESYSYADTYVEIFVKE